MNLITSAQRKQLLANGRAARDARREDRDIDPQPVVKLFTPDANCTWLLVEVDPDDGGRNQEVAMVTKISFVAKAELADKVQRRHRNATGKQTLKTQKAEPQR